MSKYKVTFHLEDLEYEVSAGNESDAYDKAYENTYDLSIYGIMDGWTTQEVD